MNNPLAGLAGLAEALTHHGLPDVPREVKSELAASPSNGAGIAMVGDYARLDLDRAARTGVPEVVYAAGKTPEQTVAITRRLVDRHGRAVVSRLGEPHLAALEAAFGAGTDEEQFVIERRAGCPTALVRRRDEHVARTGGRVGILSAGTSDVPAADEARVMAEVMGCRVDTIYDVGVAALGRLFGPLGRLFEDGVGAIVVAAGMDGALPSVVAGLSPVPVIGLPTSVGYGAGGGGMAALLSMLQSCAPGLTVVNIDNGIGAGATAELIANAAARGRGAQSEE